MQTQNNQETTPELTDAIVADGQAKFNVSRNTMQFYQWYWWEIDEYLRGNQFSSYQYNPQTNTIFINPDSINDSIQTKITINKLFSTLRVLKGFINKGDTGIVAIPIDEDGSDAVYEEAKQLSAFSYYIYRKLHVTNIRAQVSDFALRRSLGVVKLLWNQELDGGNGFIEAPIIDPYDFYWDPKTTSLEESDHVFHCVRRSIDYIQNNPKYDKKNRMLVQPDDLLSVSSAKQQELQMHYPGISATDSKLEDRTAIVYEYHYRKRNKTTNKIEYWVAHYAGNYLLSNRKSDFPFFPFVVYWTDHHPQEMVGEGGLKHLVPLSRVLNRLESQRGDFNNTFNKGAFITDKASGVQVVDNRSGKIFRVNANARFEQLDQKPMAPTLEEQRRAILEYWDDISGVTQAMQGDKPAGTRSGVELDNLQEAGANNIQEMRDNMDIFLEEFFTKVFKMCYVYYKQPRRHPIGRYANSTIMQQFISAKYADDTDGTVAIPDNINITISPDNLIGYSSEQRFNRLMQMEAQQIVDPQAVLETLAFPGFQEVIARMQARKKQEQEDQMQMESKQTIIEHQAKNMPAPPKVSYNIKGIMDQTQTGEIMQADGFNPIPGLTPDVQSAMHEDQLMEQGIPVPPTQNPSIEHTLAHVQRMNHPDHRNFPEHVHIAKFSHIQGEQDQHKQAQLQGQLQAMQQAQMMQGS